MKPLTKEQKIQSFEDKYIPEPMSGCWLWEGRIDAWGYGGFGIVDRAHRFSWEAHNGQIPEEMCVLHKCDTPSCVNPDHLFLGTNDDNVADRVAKGRSAKGEQHGKAKLTDRQILEIRDMSGTLQEIGDYYGVHNSHISRIKNRIVRGYL